MPLPSCTTTTPGPTAGASAGATVKAGRVSPSCGHRANSSTGPAVSRPSTRLSSSATDATRRPTPQSQGHALGGQGHLRAHGRPGLCRPLLRRRPDGRRGPRARGAARRPRARHARGVRARGPVAARRRGDVERAARALGDRAHGQRRRRHRAHRHPPPRHPGRAGRRPRRRRGGLAPRAGATRSRCSRTVRSPTRACPPRSACASSPSGAARSG